MKISDIERSVGQISAPMNNTGHHTFTIVRCPHCQKRLFDLEDCVQSGSFRITIICERCGTTVSLGWKASPTS